MFLLLPGSGNAALLCGMISMTGFLFAYISPNFLGVSTQYWTVFALGALIAAF